MLAPHTMIAILGGTFLAVAGLGIAANAQLRSLLVQPWALPPLPTGVGPIEKFPDTLPNTGEIVRIEMIHAVLTGQYHDLPLPNGNVRRDWMSSQSNTPALPMPPTRNFTQNLVPIPSRSPNPSFSDLPIGYKSKAEVTAEEAFIQRNAENSGEYVGPRIRQTIPPGKSLSCYKNLFEGHTLTDTHGNVWSFARNHYFTPEFRWCDAVINGHLARNGDFTSVIRLVRGKIYGESAKGNGWWLWDGFSFSVNVGRPP
jgi:hypothetical protein